MGVMNRRRILMMQRPSPLPPQYRGIAWIGGTGYQFIDTGVIPAPTDVYSFSGSFNENVENCVLFGCRSSGTYTGANHLYLNRNVGTQILALFCNSARASQYSSNIVFAQGKALPIEIDERNIAIAAKINQSAFQPTQPIYLLGFNVLGSNNPEAGGGKMRYFAIQGRCEFIPCVRIADDEPGMYETVTRSFFTNAGTGDFIVPA